MTLPTLLPVWRRWRLPWPVPRWLRREFAPSTDTFAACAAITTDAARLACYDRLFGRTPEATAAADAAEAARRHAAKSGRPPP